jgi:shikimate dehydrogenase
VPDSAIQEVVCCVGHPVAGNPTQFMMQRALAAAGLDWCCLTLEVAPEDLEDAIRGIRALGFKGANLHHPHKISAIPFLNSISETARRMNAVNCICRVKDELHGENTDGQGFVESLHAITEVRDRRVLLLGAGGAASAIAVELGVAGVAEVQIANRTAERAAELVERLNEQQLVNATQHPWEDPIDVSDEVGILINATAIGYLDADAEVPVRVGSFSPSLVVADVIVNPPNTWLLREAEARGCTVLKGLDMLVRQAALDFKLWTGREPDTAVMREAVEEFLEI